MKKISSKALLEKTFSKDDEKKTFEAIWEAFLQFPELPILENEQVLRNTIVEGVKDKALGLQVDDKVWYGELIPSDIIGEDSLILRKELAQKTKAKEETPTDITPTIGPTIPIPIPPAPAVKAYKKIKLSATVPWDKLSEIVRGVINPLRQDGAQVSLNISLEAESEKGISSDTLDLQIKETLNQIGAKILSQDEVPMALPEISKLMKIIEAGENHKVEFKSSLIWDYMKNNKNEELGVVAAKVVCAFMNSDGGTLIIGVSDDKKMLGLENDLKQLKQSSLDVFQQHFVNTINKYLGKTCCPLAKMSFEKILEKDLAIVEAEKSPSPVWIKYKDSTGEKEEFYVRSGNSNQPLNAHEAHDYIRNHWPQH